MDTLSPTLFEVPVTRISDEAYFPAALALLRAAQVRCLISMFIVDHDLRGDPGARIDVLLVELAAARWRGVDVKLLVGGSRTSWPIMTSCLTAVARAKELGVAARLAATRPDQDTHLKLLIADDGVLSGSHNWARGAIGGQTQDSALFAHATMAATLAREFAAQWNASSPEAFDVSV